MSEVKTFFRFCPSCGKRFHIKLVSKKLVDDKRETTVRKEVTTAGRVFVGSRFQPINPTILVVDVPVTVEVEDFEYSYKCGYCGHVWTEKRRREAEIKK